MFSRVLRLISSNDTAFSHLFPLTDMKLPEVISSVLLNAFLAFFTFVFSHTISSPLPASLESLRRPPPTTLALSETFFVFRESGSSA